MRQNFGFYQMRIQIYSSFSIHMNPIFQIGFYASILYSLNDKDLLAMYSAIVVFQVFQWFIVEMILRWTISSSRFMQNSLKKKLWYKSQHWNLFSSHTCTNYWNFGTYKPQSNSFNQLNCNNTKNSIQWPIGRKITTYRLIIMLIRKTMAYPFVKCSTLENKKWNKNFIF